jgi:hypothetical protein
MLRMPAKRMRCILKSNNAGRLKAKGIWHCIKYRQYEQDAHTMFGGSTHARAVNCRGSNRTRTGGDPIGILHTCVAPSVGITSKKRPRGQARSTKHGSCFHMSETRVLVECDARSVIVTEARYDGAATAFSCTVSMLTAAKRSVGPSHCSDVILLLATCMHEHSQISRS